VSGVTPSCGWQGPGTRAKAACLLRYNGGGWGDTSFCLRLCDTSCDCEGDPQCLRFDANVKAATQREGVCGKGGTNVIPCGDAGADTGDGGDDGYRTARRVSRSDRRSRSQSDHFASRDTSKSCRHRGIGDGRSSREVSAAKIPAKLVLDILRKRHVVRLARVPKTPPRAPSRAGRAPSRATSHARSKARGLTHGGH
jgi:hypothetical protein